MRKQMTFFRSFWDATKRLKRDEDRLSTLEAILAYALDGEEIPMTDVAEGIFILIKPTLDASKRKSDGRATSTEQTDPPETENNNGAIHEDAEKTEGKCEEDACKKTLRYGEDVGKIPTRHNKDTEKEKEKEKEGEYEVEVEREYEREYENECYVSSSDDDDKNARARANPVVAVYCEKISAIPSTACISELVGFSERLGAELCLRAIDIALDANARNWPYIKAILQRWQEAGYQTLADVDLAEAARQRKKGKAVDTVGDKNAWMDEFIHDDSAHTRRKNGGGGVRFRDLR